MLNLNSAVDIVARASEVLKMRAFLTFFFESSTHPYGEKKNVKKGLRLRAYDARSRCLLRNLGLYVRQ